MRGCSRYLFRLDEGRKAARSCQGDPVAIMSPGDLNLRKDSISGVGLDFGGYRYRWESACELQEILTYLGRYGICYRQVNIHPFRHDAANMLHRRF
jgi:hypothetical protein